MSMKTTVTNMESTLYSCCIVAAVGTIYSRCPEEKGCMTSLATSLPAHVVQAHYFRHLPRAQASQMCWKKAERRGR